MGNLCDGRHISIFYDFFVANSVENVQFMLNEVIVFGVINGYSIKKRIQVKNKTFKNKKPDRILR